MRTFLLAKLHAFQQQRSTVVSPPNHKDLVTRYTPIPSYIVHSTRCLRGNQDKFIKPSATVDAYKFSFYPRSIILWNQLQINDIVSLKFNDFDSILQSTLTHSVINNLKTLFLYSNL